MKKAAEILGRILDEKGRGKAEIYSSVFGGWGRIVGVSLAEHSRIYEIRYQNLFIEVDHPGWMQMLLMRKRKILQTVQREYPQLSIADLKIRVNLNYESQGTADKTPVSAAQKGSEVEVREIEDVVAGVKSEELKKKLKRLFLTCRDRATPG